MCFECDVIRQTHYGFDIKHITTHGRFGYVAIMPHQEPGTLTEEEEEDIAVKGKALQKFIMKAVSRLALQFRW
jgi:hypothetical protein